MTKYEQIKNDIAKRKATNAEIASIHGVSERLVTEIELVMWRDCADKLAGWQNATFEERHEALTAYEQLKGIHD
jgi:hypothetical protein